MEILYQILKNKLITAINFDCDSMNAESRVKLNPNAHEGGGGGYDSDSYNNWGDEEE